MGYLKTIFSYLKKANKLFNDSFVTVFLIFFYFLIVGIASVIYRISKLKEKVKVESFWTKPKSYKKNDFLSSF